MPSTRFGHRTSDDGNSTSTVRSAQRDPSRRPRFRTGTGACIGFVATQIRVGAIVTIRINQSILIAAKLHALWPHHARLPANHDGRSFFPGGSRRKWQCPFEQALRTLVFRVLRVGRKSRRHAEHFNPHLLVARNGRAIPHLNLDRARQCVHERNAVLAINAL